MPRLGLFASSLLLLAWMQFRESGLPGLQAELEIDTGQPSRIYLLKNGNPFRLSPVDALLPLKVPLFSRERLGPRAVSPETLEVTGNEQSHVILLRGRGRFVVPPGRYRLPAYLRVLPAPSAAPTSPRD